MSRDILALFSSKSLDGLGFGWSVSINSTKQKEAHLRLVKSWGQAPGCCPKGWRMGTVMGCVVLGRDLLGHDILSVSFITQNAQLKCWALSTCVLICSWNKKYGGMDTGQLLFAKEQHCYSKFLLETVVLAWPICTALWQCIQPLCYVHCSDAICTALMLCALPYAVHTASCCVHCLLLCSQPLAMLLLVYMPVACSLKSPVYSLWTSDFTVLACSNRL